MVFSDRRILWHPRHPRFVVGGPNGGSITLYEYSSTHPRIKHITSHDDLQHMRCLAWSPDPSFDDLLAVGLSNGKIDLIKLETNLQANVSGVLNRSASATTSVRSSRACNAIAFSEGSPNLLACGFDKVRGDHSLIIWDLQNMYPRIIAKGVSSPLDVLDQSTYTFPSGGSPSTNSPRATFQTAAAEVVNAVSFLPGSDQHLLAGVAGRFLRLYDLRLGSTAAIAASVNMPCKVQGLATDPLDHNRFGCWGDGLVTVWDQRQPTTSLLTFSASDAGIDVARRHSHGSSSVGTITHLEFSPTRRGLLATLEKDSSHMRLWDIQQTPLGRDGTEIGAGQLGKGTTRNDGGQTRVSKISWTSPAALMSSWTGSGNAPAEPTPIMQLAPGLYRAVLANSWSTNAYSRPLTTFALVPNSKTPTVITANKDGDLEVREMEDTFKHVAWSNRGPLAIGSGTAYSVTEIVTPSVAVDDLPMDSLILNGAQYDSIVIPPELKSRSSSIDLDDTSLERVLRSDITALMRLRAQKGYGVNDPLANVQICREVQSEDTTLADIWSWVSNSARLLSHPEPKVGGFNFAYQGIMNIWEGLPSIGPMDAPNVPASSPMPSVTASPTLSSRTLLEVPSSSSIAFPSSTISSADSTSSTYKKRGKLSRRSRSPVDSIHSDFHEAVLVVLARSNSGVGPGTSRVGSEWQPPVISSKVPHRRLALELLDWDGRHDGVHASASRWANEGHVTRAACWFAFIKDHSSAVDVLMKSNDESHFMLSGTLAAFTSFSGSSPKRHDLREHCERLIPRLDDPYLRAMLTFVISDEWGDVLDEQALSLRERLAISVHFLDDSTLGSYLRRTTELCRISSEIEGLVLTGLTVTGVDLLQAWIDRTGDVQTASLLIARATPSKHRDARVERWIEAYRDLLDSWQMFPERCNFDIARGQVLSRAIAAGDTKHYEWAPKQFLIRCNYCNKGLDGPSPYDGRPTVCPHCKRPLPRCSICLLTLRVLPDGARTAEALLHPSRSSQNEDPIVVCQSCRHGGHASHIMDWFFDVETGEQLHKTCPIADCECPCASEM